MMFPTYPKRLSIKPSFWFIASRIKASVWSHYPVTEGGVT